ncbi:hypothetical protein TNCV_4481731 [Trichonephila clavipes]|nr:hypothetical protein TNCV_4481731 [Trichonephila clavipes]
MSQKRLRGRHSAHNLIKIERADSEKTAWVSQIWPSVIGRKCETTLCDDNAKPYCNFWLGSPSPSTSPNLAPRDFHLFLALKKNLA